MDFSDDSLCQQTTHYSLRPLTLDDAQDLFAEMSEPRVTEFMDIEAMTEVSEAVEVIEWTQDIRAKESGFRWAIRTTQGEFAGTMGFNRILLEHGRRGEITYDLKRSFWGKGVINEVLPSLLRLGFDHFELERLEAFVTPGNAASAGVLMRHGFAFEGILRHMGFWKGQFWDQEVYSKLSGDP